MEALNIKQNPSLNHVTNRNSHSNVNLVKIKNIKRLLNGEERAFRRNEYLDITKNMWN